MAQDRTAPSRTEGIAQGRAPAQAQPRLLRGLALGPAHRRAVEGCARLLPLGLDLLAPPARLGRDRRVGGGVGGLRRGVGRRGSRDVGSGLRRRDVRPGEKGGDCVGKTKRGKGTKLVVVGSGASVPLALTVASASPSATKLIGPTLDKLRGHPKRIVLDKEFDSDKFRDKIAARGIDPIIP